MRLAALETESIVNGPGLRIIIWTQGCPHHCPGCHNPQTHDPNGGREVSLKEIKNFIKKNKDYHQGITFSGGDPLLQPKPINEIARYAHTLGLDVWCYTGYTYEQIPKEYLKNIDVLVDGPFVQSKKSYDCIWRGSTNQRLIRLKGGDIDEFM